MYAIVEIAGQQFKIEKDQKLYVHRLKEEEGSTVSIDKVLLIGDDNDIKLGAPVIEGAFAEAKVLGHLKGDKVIVFKKKRRKGYRKKNGHRQSLTQIQISSISAVGGTTKKTDAKKETKPTKKSETQVDDFKKIEGIGPKIATTLNEAGINTYAQLAATDASQISEIIAGVRGNHITDSWPMQAQLAADGKWDELKKWQDDANGGVMPS